MRISRYISCLIPIVALAVCLAACETVSDPGDVPYRERLVVRGELQVGEKLWDVQISRTLPLTETYTKEKAAVTDATVTVEENGTPYALHYDQTGHYSAPELIIKSGAVYKLSIDWHGKHVTATTTAPYPVPIASVELKELAYKYDSTYKYFAPNVVFHPVGNQVYGLSFDYTSLNSFSQSFSLDDYSRIMRRSDTSADGTIALLYGSSGMGVVSAGDIVTVHLLSFDTPFYDYYTTDNPYGSGDDIFFSAGDNTRWNVQGDAVGIFIARQVTDTTFNVR
ncbi:MAG: hypothetical protein JWQ98_988 [Chlorobi bacterium]|nr:hypothetical protein [Chlorobiota bacterium]